MKKIFGVILMAAALTFAGTATAGSWYGMLNANKTMWDVESDPVPFDVDVSNTNGFGIGIGRHMNNWLSLELTYDDLGENEVTGTIPNAFRMYTPYDLHAKASSVGLWAKGEKEVFSIAGKPVSLSARLGLARTQATAFFVGMGSMTDKSTKLAYGIGASLAVTSNIDLKLDLTKRTMDFYNRDVDFTTASAGIQYNF